MSWGARDAERRGTLVRDGSELVWRLTPARQPPRTGSPAPPVVLLHGLASNMTRWNEFTRETSLKNRHDLIRIDLRGHGESMTRHRFTRSTWQDDLLAILDAEGKATAWLVGHSMGASVALATAAVAPARVCGLVLIDPLLREAVTQTHRRIVRFGPLLACAAALVRRLNRLGLYRRRLTPLDLEALDREARAALQSSDPAALAAFVRRYSSVREDLRHLPLANYLQDLVEMFRPLPSLATINCPTLILCSTIAEFQDSTVLRQRFAEIRHVEIRPIECHHWPLTERPREVRAAIEQFIDAVQTAAPA